MAAEDLVEMELIGVRVELPSNTPIMRSSAWETLGECMVASTRCPVSAAMSAIVLKTNPEAMVRAYWKAYPARAPLPGDELADLVMRFKNVLGDRVTAVRATDRLTDSPARLVDPEGAPDQSMQRVYRLLNKEFEEPKKELEINPQHPLMTRIRALPSDDPRVALVIEQLYEDALLIEGIHPDPASMIERIQELMARA